MLNSFSKIILFISVFIICSALKVWSSTGQEKSICTGSERVYLCQNDDNEDVYQEPEQDDGNGDYGSSTNEPSQDDSEGVPEDGESE